MNSKHMIKPYSINLNFQRERNIHSMINQINDQAKT